MIGVPKQTFRDLNRAELGAVVVVDLEEKTFESPDVDVCFLISLFHEHIASDFACRGS